jgi:hypothetical protein
VQWGDAATWALVIVGALAFRAAWLAYRKQADAASKLAEQVDLQRDQLKDQQEANRKQAQVMDAQLREMQQRAEAYERQQADAITLSPQRWGSRVPGLREGQGPSVHMARVTNQWHRPIRNVVCRIQPAPGDPMHEACLVGQVVRLSPSPVAAGHVPTERIGDVAEDTKMDLVRPDAAVVFVFMYEIAQYLDARMTLRFTDDAGLHWQIDHDQHLEKLDSRDW